jgi:hypothetical protein
LGSQCDDLSATGSRCDVSHGPSPLNEQHSVSLEAQENCLELIESVAAKTTLKRKEGNILGKIALAAKALAVAAKADVGQAAKAT